MIVRESFALLPPYTPVIMYAILIPIAFVFIYGIHRIFARFGLWAALRSVRLDSLAMGFERVITQRRVIERLKGFPHLFLFLGTLLLFLGTLTVFLETDILKHFGLVILRDLSYFAFEFIMDLAGLIFILGILFLLPTREREGKLLLLGLLYIGISGFLMESIRISSSPNEASQYSFIGYYVSKLIGSSLREVYEAIWWSHAILAFVMVAYLPYSNLLHSLTSLVTSSLEGDELEFPKEPFLLQEIEDIEGLKIGFESPEELPWYEKYRLAACVKCGRCTESCPANQVGRPLSPRDVVLGLRNSLLGASYELRDETVWSCVACGACSTSCPNYVKPFEFLMERRRKLVFDGRIDKKMGELINSLRRYKNSFSVPQRGRLDWLSSDEDPDYYIWVGCQYSFDPIGRRIVSRLVDLLRSAGLRIATIGEMETCCGEPVRRLGEEGMFQEFAIANSELFKELGVKRLLVVCPHGLTVFRKEYPRIVKNWSLEVISHVELLARLYKEGKLKLRQLEAVTFHDPCNLSRYNNIVEEPRSILEGLKGYREMRRNGRDTFCCGAGGANYWYQTGESVMAKERVREAQEAGVRNLVVACPFCYAMINDAMKGMGVEDLKVLEISELLE
ncbi:MAG: (Fe-S)-binding protein [Candidatus Korarchaeum sp.]|nr:(Fe-S)-binding protein [Candidatus Korarchaeum sp.]